MQDVTERTRLLLPAINVPPVNVKEKPIKLSEKITDAFKSCLYSILAGAGAGSGGFLFCVMCTKFSAIASAICAAATGTVACGASCCGFFHSFQSKRRLANIEITMQTRNPAPVSGMNNV